MTKAEALKELNNLAGFAEVQLDGIHSTLVQATLNKLRTYIMFSQPGEIHEDTTDTGQ